MLNLGPSQNNNNKNCRICNDFCCLFFVGKHQEINIYAQRWAISPLFVHSYDEYDLFELWQGKINLLYVRKIVAPNIESTNFHLSLSYIIIYIQERLFAHLRYIHMHENLLFFFGRIWKPGYEGYIHHHFHGSSILIMILVID